MSCRLLFGSDVFIPPDPAGFPRKTKREKKSLYIFTPGQKRTIRGETCLGPKMGQGLGQGLGHGVLKPVRCPTEWNSPNRSTAQTDFFFLNLDLRHLTPHLMFVSFILCPIIQSIIYMADHVYYIFFFLISCPVVRRLNQCPISMFWVQQHIM